VLSSPNGGLCQSITDPENPENKAGFGFYHAAPKKSVRPARPGAKILKSQTFSEDAG
jgi:hypothetical protein